MALYSDKSHEELLDIVTDLHIRLNLSTVAEPPSFYASEDRGSPEVLNNAEHEVCSVR